MAAEPALSPVGQLAAWRESQARERAKFASDDAYLEHQRRRHALRLHMATKDGNWRMALGLASSVQRLGVLSRAWHLIPPRDKPVALADAISTGDLLVRERRFLLRALRDLRHLGPCVFDSDAARQRFEQLPERITIHRGTVEAEGRRYGVSWTLDAERAAWFAKGYRCSNTASSPVLLACEIDKADASGLLVERMESEVIIHPDALKGRRVTRAKVKP